MDKLFKQNLLGTFTNVTKYRKCTSLFFSRQVAVNNQHSVHKQCWFTNLKTLTCQREVLYHWTCYFARKSFEITSPHTHTLPENRFVTANVPLSVFGVSSHRLRRLEFILSCEGVSRPGVAWPGVAWPGVASHMWVLAPGVAPGVSPPLPWPGVSSQRVVAGVDCQQNIKYLTIWSM